MGVLYFAHTNQTNQFAVFLASLLRINNERDNTSRPVELMEIKTFNIEKQKIKLLRPRNKR